jgi:hypothetical protein
MKSLKQDCSEPGRGQLASACLLRFLPLPGLAGDFSLGGVEVESATMKIDIRAYSDDIGHLFRFYSDSVPGLADSSRSEATLGSHSSWVSE